MHITVESSAAPATSVPRRVTVIAAGILVTVGIFMAVSGDFSRLSPPTLTASTELTSKATQLTTTNGLPSATAEDCANVKDWNFFHSTVTQNNLGGVGPNKSDKQEVRFADVADMIDLVLTIDKAHQVKPYVTNDVNKKNKADWTPGYENNGISGKFGEINIRGGTSVAMQFTLVESGTDIPVQIAPEQTVFFSVYDLDGTSVGQEYIKFTTPVDSYKTTTSTTVKIAGGDTNLQATAGRGGSDLDNPSDPLALTQLQMDSTVWIAYKGRNTWGMTFGEAGNPKGQGGRNLLFAGRADGDCPPGAMDPPPGACTAGIEGMIKGGGRVCCPDECGQQGIGAKWADAPNACGGPGCDKGPDGIRTDYRYNNCCVGKPISGGTAKETITAPYGITSQGRFCTGLGSDAPPCINKLSRLSDRL